jgi:hypothetical protein
MFAKMRQGWDLTKKAWGVIRAHPRLAKLPLTGGILAVVVGFVMIGSGLLLASTETDAAVVIGAVLMILGAYAASFIIIYYNVILAAAADEALQGREPDLDHARGVARSRIGVIAAWALVSAAMSALFAALRDRGGAAGQLAASLGGAIWGLVTFLVVPVLAFEGIGPIAAVKRSASLFRQRWGQQVTGNLAIGGIAGLISFVGAVLVVVGLVLVAGGTTGGIAGGAVLAIVGLVIAIGGAVFGGATRGVFGVALYHYVAEDRALGPFSEADLASTASRG